MIKQPKVFISALIGNILEFYDLALYAIYASQFAILFFPDPNLLKSIVYSWLTFSVGLLSRPLGSIFFGFIGDYYGRKDALFFSILSMSVSTLLIGILPDFSVLGILAPITLILLRFVQGFSVGGECNGAAIFSLEHEENHKLGLKGSILIGSSVIGALFAVLSGILLCKFEHGWRISFIFGAMVGFVGLYIRNNLSETFNFFPLTDSQPRSRILSRLRNNYYIFWKELLLTCFLGGINGSLYYTLLGYSNYHFSTILHYSNFISLSLMAIGMVVFIISAVLVGHLSEIIGIKKTLQISCVVILFAIFPCFYFLNKPGIIFSILAIVMLAILTSGVGAPLHAFVLNLFPLRTRYLAISVGFNVGIAFFGGTTPAIFTWISSISNNFIILSLYPFSISFVTLLLLIVLPSKEHNKFDTTTRD